MKLLITITVLFMFLPVMIYGQNSSVKIMTYNLKFDDPDDEVNNWDRRKMDVIALLNFYEPDLIGTQEGLKHQIDQIDRSLENHAYVGVGRDTGGEEGEFTAIFVDTTRFEILDNGTFWLSETPGEPSRGWDAAIKRITTYILIRDLETNNEFYLFNAHLDHIGRNSRLESVKLIWEKYEEKSGRTRVPVVIMGDLNAEPGDPPVQYLSDRLYDTYGLTENPPYGPEGTFNAFNFNEKPERRIDYIFTDDNFRVLKYAAINDFSNFRYPSDHFPVYIEVFYKE